jgi:hypothetical protein
MPDMRREPFKRAAGTVMLEGYEQLLLKQLFNQGELKEECSLES